MSNDTDDEQLRYRAEKRVEEKLGFRTHLVVYVAVNIFLFLIWLLTSLFAADGWIFPWFIFPLVGWGIAIVIHAFSVYGVSGSEERREAMIQKEMEKMKGGRD